MSRRAVLALASLIVASSVACAAPPASADKNDDDGRFAGPSPAAEEEPAPGKPSSGSKGGPSGAAGGAIDLGTVAAGGEVTFDVPAGTLGFTIIVDAINSGSDYLGVQELRDPTGALVITNFKDANDDDGRFMQGWGGAGAHAVRFPFVTDLATEPVRAGKWKARLGGTTAVAGGGKGATTPMTGRVHGAVRMQVSSDGTFKGGAIDLDIYVPDGLEVGDSDKGAARTVTAATAGADPGIKARVDLTYGLFQRLYGLQRGDVRFHAVPGSFKELVGQEQVDDANRQATVVGARPAAQVVLTNRLSPEPDGEISGVSNCLPGAVGLAGTECSAVIVSLRPGAPDWWDATTLVHELGHFAGLEHTTEFGGQFDSLADTPQCTATGKEALASCPDHDNLMFPSVNMATSQDSVAVSETQRSLMRSSILYRALP